jgi:hypothetical protein
MDQEIEKIIADITVNYEDGTQSKLQYYTVVGLGDDTWYNIMQSPPNRDAKIKMNNYLVELSNKLIESIGM